MKRIVIVALAAYCWTLCAVAEGEAAQGFLRRANIPFRTAESRGADRSAADVGDIAHRSTVFLRCEK